MRVLCARPRLGLQGARGHTVGLPDSIASELLQSRGPSHPRAAGAGTGESDGLIQLAAGVGRLGAWSWDVGSPTSQCSREACAILGLRPGFQPSMPEVLACFTREDRSRLRATFVRALRHGSPFDVELESIRPDGSRAWVRLIGEPEWNEDARVTRMQGAVQDVTPARRVRQQLQESQRALATLIGNLPGMAYRCANSADWPFTFASEGAMELTGYSARQLTSGEPHYGDLIHPDDAPGVWSQVQSALARRERFEVTYRLRTPRGERWVWERGSGVYVGNGSICCLEGFITDITEAKRVQGEISRINHTLEDRVRDRTAQLESANAEMEAFAYSIAHDLRAPMTTLAGFSQILAERLGGLDDRSSHYLRRIVENVAHMSDLTDALLSLAHLSGVDIARDPVDLGELAEVVVAQLREQEPARSTRITIAPGLRATGDRRLLQQVLANLLGNAWKFSRTREVVTIEVGALAPAAGQATFFVRDRGVGFDMAHASQLFGPFRRLHTRSEFEGTGIGLALVHKIVLRHGGRVWAEAQPDQGATIFFTLPSADQA